jgi:regulator of protease activity HflC (stomatin/prohibitin superfamily)
MRLLAVAAGIGLLYLVWRWEIERVEVQPGEYLVRIHRWGKDLTEDQIVAPDESYKGVMLDVLPEGRHFLNPLFWSRETRKIISVPPGECLVLTRLYGEPIPEEQIARGDVVAHAEPPQRGIVQDVLLPGSYRLNHYAYQWESVPAVEIRVDQVGVRTLKVGKDPAELPVDPERSHYVVPEGYRGVQDKVVPPGTYYLNPYVESIVPVEVRSHRVELADIEFPSRDGFLIKPYVVVEYAVMPAKAPEVMVRLTDAGVLHQDDRTPEEQELNEVLQKVLLPHIRGYARIEGSNFDARDFISVQSDDPDVKTVNARETMQKALVSKVMPRCAELGIEIRAITLADMRPPPELAEQIAQRELARVEREKNVVRIRQYKAEQELRAKESLKQQATEKVEAETRLVQAKTKAEQLLEVERLRLEQDLLNSQLRLDAAKNQAAATLAQGEAAAAVIHLQNEADVAGVRRGLEGFSNPQSYAQYHVLQKLAPALSEIFATDESEIARILSGYLGQPPETTIRAQGGASGGR